jgi:hypothetical protein
VNALGWEGGTTKHPPDAPHWKPPPTEVYSADCVEGNSRNFALWGFSEVGPSSVGWELWRGASSLASTSGARFSLVRKAVAAYTKVVT